MNPFRFLSSKQRAVDAYESGLVALKDGCEEEALECFTEAIRLDGGHAKAVFERGMLFRYIDHVNTISHFTAAIGLDPGFVRAYKARGEAYLDSGDFENAVFDFDAAVRLAPKDADGYNSRGRARRIAGNLIGALEDFNRAIEFDPSFGDAYGNRGMLHEFHGDYERALSDYSTELRLSRPDGACSRLAWLLATCPRSDLRDGKRAVMYAGKCAGASPGHVVTALRSARSGIRRGGGLCEGH